MKDRVQCSSGPGTPKSELIRAAAMMSKGDGRVALETLRRAGRKTGQRTEISHHK